MGREVCEVGFLSLGVFSHLQQCLRISRCFYGYLVYVGGSDVGVPERKGSSWVIIYQCHPHNDSLCSLLLMRIITLAQSD